MKILSRILLSGTSLGCLIALNAQPVWAQSDAGAGARPEQIESVVVTARRVAERQQDVPIAITVVDDKTIKEKNINNANDLILAAPGLSNQETSGTHFGTTYSIRGQGSVFNTAPGVIVYYADMPLAGSSGVSPDVEFYDLDNVQVLKGPQGTLFGRNTTGGAVLLTPRKPSEDFEGYADARLGDYGREEFEGGIGGPIWGDKVMFRVAGESLQRDGFTKNVLTGQDLDNENRWSGRAALVVKPFEGLENYTQVVETRVDENGTGQQIAFLQHSPQNALPFTDALTPILGPLASPFVAGQTEYSYLAPELAAQQARGPRKVAISPTTQQLRSTVVINTTTWDATSYLTFKNIFSYAHVETFDKYDLDGTPLPVTDVDNPFQPNITTNDEAQALVNFEHFNGVIGYFGSWGRTKYGAAIDPVTIVSSLIPGGLSTVSVYDYGGGKSDSTAYYGQGNWEVIDGLTLTAGIRYTKDYQLAQASGFQQTVAAAKTAVPSSEGGSFHALTWTFAADYKVNDDLNVYGTVRRGYKSGGFNATAPTPAEEAYAPEYVTDYEAGVKSNFDVDGMAVRLDVDGFYDDYTNIQRSISVTIAGAPATITTNAAAARIYGSDVDLTFVPSEYFDASLLYTYTNAAYTQWLDPYDPTATPPLEGNGDLSGQHFQNTPVNQLSFTPAVHYPLDGDLGRLTALASIYYQGSEALDAYNVPNGNPNELLQGLSAATVPGYTRVDLRLEWAGIAGTNTSAAFFVTNVTNKLYVVGSGNRAAVDGGVSYTYGAPRMFGVELKYAFGGD